MSEYTPEQINDAKWHIGALERTDIIPKEARVPPYEDRNGQDWALENEALIILAALEAAEKERDEWRESARTANTALLKVCKERDELQGLIDLQHSRTVKADKLWQDAHPEQRHVCPDLGALIDWLLDRTKIRTYIEALTITIGKENRRASNLEAYAAKLEKAGDAMRNKWYLVDEPDGVDWDVARKEKP